MIRPMKITVTVFSTLLLMGSALCQVPKHTVRGYPMLDANHVYRPGEQVRVEAPHGVYSGLLAMDGVYFVRPVNVTITRRNKVSNSLFNWDGGLVADVRHSTSAAWEKRTFAGGCENIDLTVGQIEMGRFDDKDQMLIGDHGPICELKPVDNGGSEAYTSAQSESAAVAQLRTTNTAEVTYFSSNGGKYGTIQDLISTGLLDRRDAGEIDGYSYEVQVQEQGRIIHQGSGALP